jgi:hypothetical protein
MDPAASGSWSARINSGGPVRKPLVLHSMLQNMLAPLIYALPYMKLETRENAHNAGISSPVFKRCVASTWVASVLP